MIIYTLFTSWCTQCTGRSYDYNFAFVCVCLSQPNVHARLCHFDITPRSLKSHSQASVTKETGNGIHDKPSSSGSGASWFIVNFQFSSSSVHLHYTIPIACGLIPRLPDWSQLEIKAAQRHARPSHLVFERERVTCGNDALTKPIWTVASWLRCWHRATIWVQWALLVFKILILMSTYYSGSEHVPSWCLGLWIIQNSRLGKEQFVQWLPQVLVYTE